MAKRKRRSFTAAYKAEVVELVRKGGKSIGAVAKDLDLTETAVRGPLGSGARPHVGASRAHTRGSRQRY